MLPPDHPANHRKGCRDGECPGCRPADEAIDHPVHYGGADDPYEAIKVICAWMPDGGYSFCIGNSIKYISRAGKKDPSKTVEDLAKSRWYLDYAIGLLKAEQ